jgi:hypothetical protein
MQHKNVLFYKTRSAREALLLLLLRVALLAYSIVGLGRKRGEPHAAAWRCG